MISMKSPTEKYTYGSVSRYNSCVLVQDYCDPDTGDDVTGKVDVQVDRDGVYIEVKNCGNDRTESVSIPTHDLAVAVAEYILERYGFKYVKEGVV